MTTSRIDNQCPTNTMPFRMYSRHDRLPNRPTKTHFAGTHRRCIKPEAVASVRVSHYSVDCWSCQQSHYNAIPSQDTIELLAQF